MSERETVVLPAPARQQHAELLASSREAKPPIHEHEDSYEREARRIADQVMSSGSPSDSNDRGGRHSRDPRALPRSLTDFFEPRFRRDFADVRVHVDSAAAEAARATRAQAFTLGRDIFFAAGAYAPQTNEGKRLVAHELTHVVQQGRAPRLSADALDIRYGAGPIVQRSQAADARLPSDQPEAIAFATTAMAAIDAARVRLAAVADPRSHDIPAFITQRGITLAALTPRHDSVVGAPQINFFAGQTDYAQSVVLPETSTHHIDAARTSVRIRAREHANVDNLLPAADIEQLLVQAVSEVAHTAAEASGAPTRLSLYTAQFNSLWHVAPFAALSTRYDPTLDSKGPRATRARAIFDKIYADDAALRAAYDANTAGIRDAIDTYTGPDSLNAVNSPRLQRLREAFFPFSVPVPAANYPAFVAAVQAAANGLEQSDRDAVDNSNAWQLLIDRYILTQARRAEIRTIIRTPPPAPAAVVAAAGAGGPVAAPPVGGAVTPQMFVDAIRIDGPAAPILANARRERVTLTPVSAHPNPAVPINTRFTVTPAGRVDGPNVSLVSPWSNASATGVPFDVPIINTATVAMNAHLDLLNGPAGLAPAMPIPDLAFTVQDNRETKFIANWRAAVTFNTGARQDWFVAGTSVVTYRGGTQNFRIVGFLPQAAVPNTNPGLTLFVKARIKRAGVNVAAPATFEPFPPDRNITTPIAINVAAPAVVPAAGDPLDFEVELIAADRATVLDMKPMAIPVLPEVRYSRADAIAAAVADDAHLHDTSAAGLLGKMSAAGGLAASVAAAVKPLPPTVPPPGPLITLRPLTVRHDSASYVKDVMGGPHPELAGYFVGTTYTLARPDAHSLAEVVNASGFRIPSGFGPRFIAANRTTDVPTGTKRSDAELIELISHEAVHAMDVTPSLGGDLERYKREFRAYWMDGGFGPPDSAVCPPGAPATCKEATTDPTMPPGGPKSPRARAIFDHLYNSPAYDYVKKKYDNDSRFRAAVDNYVIPDGINLIVSVRLESLRQLIAGITTGNFAARRTSIQGFFGIGAAPTVGVLTADERNEIQRNRAWRDLIEAEVPGAANRALIKADLSIPV